MCVRTHLCFVSELKKEKRSVYHKVSAGVLTMCGTRGLLLKSPRMVPSESHEHIGALWKEIALHRREHLGIQGCPVASGSDNMRRDYLLIDRCVQEVFPELVKLHDGNIAAFHKKGQDRAHAYNRFPRVLPQRLSNDHGTYKSAAKSAIMRCKLPQEDPDPTLCTVETLPAEISDGTQLDQLYERIQTALSTVYDMTASEEQQDLIHDLLVCMGAKNFQAMTKLGLPTRRFRCSS